MHAPEMDHPTPTQTPGIDDPTVAAPGVGQSAKAAKAAHSQKGVNAGVKDRDKMRAQVKDRIIQCFCEYSYLFYVVTPPSFPF